MATVVTRLFADTETVDAAIAELKNEGFGSLDYTIVSEGSSLDTVDEALKNAGVRPKDAPAFAQSVRSGNTAVVVRAPFGAAGIAVFILDHFKPVQVQGGRGQVMVAAGRRAPPPLANAKILSGPGLPAIVNWKTPFEYFFWAPSIIKTKSRGTLMSGMRTPLSSIIPAPIIIKPKPSKKPLRSRTFSSMIGFPEVIKYRSKTHVF